MEFIWFWICKGAAEFLIGLFFVGAVFSVIFAGDFAKMIKQWRCKHKKYYNYAGQAKCVKCRKVLGSYQEFENGGKMKTIESKTTCPMCGHNKWEVQKKTSGMGVFILVIGWIVSLSACSKVATSASIGGFGGILSGILIFIPLILIFFFTARKYDNIDYVCLNCKHITKL